MLWNLDVSWLAFAFVMVALFSFALGAAIDGLIGEDGFGPTGNAIVITAGFFLGVFAVNSYGISLRDPSLATAAGLGGAFVTLMMLALLKAGLNRV